MSAEPTTEPTVEKPATEPWFALPLSDLQIIQSALQRQIIAGQEASALLRKLMAAAPAQNAEDSSTPSEPKENS